MQNKPGLWRQTPPAIFPPILGLLGLGLAWRRAPDVFPIPSAVGEAVLGAVSLIFIFAAIAYLAKIVRRPTALVDDLRIMPGRAGVSAASMSAMLFAAVIFPYFNCVSAWVLSAGILAHLTVAAIVIGVLWNSPFAARRMTPVWHLTFVGVIVAPIAAVPLGWTALSEIILYVSIAVASTIWIGNLIGMIGGKTPPPLRPTLAIHLAPVGVLGIVSALMGHLVLAQIYGWAGVALAGLLLFRVRYLTAAGFSPFWGAFTFPIAAFTTLMIILAQNIGGPFRVFAGVALIFATLTIPVIAFKILKMWAAGPLAVKTNASSV